MNNQAYDWVPFYKELADKLLPYQDNRPELIEKVVMPTPPCGMMRKIFYTLYS